MLAQALLLPLQGRKPAVSRPEQLRQAFCNVLTSWLQPCSPTPRPPEWYLLKSGMLLCNPQVQSYKRKIKQLEDDLLFRLSNSTGNLLDDTELVDILAVTKQTAQVGLGGAEEPAWLIGQGGGGVCVCVLGWVGGWA